MIILSVKSHRTVVRETKISKARYYSLNGYLVGALELLCVKYVLRGS